VTEPCFRRGKPPTSRAAYARSSSTGAALSGECRFAGTLADAVGSADIPVTSRFPSWLAVVATLAATLTLIDNASDLATAGTSLGPLGITAFGVVNVWIVGTALNGLRRRVSIRPHAQASDATGATRVVS
jgi:hypothetical protein